MGMKKLDLAAVADLIRPQIADVTDNPRANPRKLKPGQLLQVLNSTPLGPVLDDRRLREWRAEAGLKFGDGKTIDLLRFVGYLAGRKHFPVAPDVPEQLDVAAAYERKKDRERERNAASSRAGRDIAPLPVVKNPKRRAKAEASLLKFTVYFPDRFTLKFSQDHRDLIAEIERTIVKGGQIAFALPRGSGKTTIVEVAVIWAVITGRRQFVALIGASQDAADELLQSIKTELESNDLLAEDFPEVCYPIARLEGINNRCKGQLCDGLRTQIKWSGQSIVLPTVEGSKASGAIVRVAGITGRVRGMKFTRSDGKTVRPDLVIPDDPQTDESARSPAQTLKRMKIITGAILGLAGPSKKIAAAMPCTVIEPDDLADQLLDRSRHPEWNGKRCKLVHEWPTTDEAKKHWDEYAEIRRRDLASGGDGSQATAYYRKHRRAMDEGSRVAWPERKLDDELSALQHAYNIRIDHPLTFDAEYQNEPKRHDGDQLAIVPPSRILIQKLSRVPRFTVPLVCDRVTAFVDVQQDILFYVVAAWSPEFTGSVIDYGTEPDQRRHYFHLGDLTQRLRDKHAGANIDGALLAGLRDLLSRLLNTAWHREDGVSLRIGRALVDAGYKNHLVYQVCREAEFSAACLPSYGRAIGPQQKPITAYEKKPGDQIGLNWMVTRAVKRASRHVLYDTNWWKSFIFDRFGVSPGEHGEMTLYGTDPQSHHLLAEHLTAEYPTQLESKAHGRTVTVWDAYPGRANHWLDGLVGSAVAASISGAKLKSIDDAHRPARARRRITAADLPTRRRV